MSLKRKAEETLEVLSTIINGCIENSSQAAQGSLPNSHASKNKNKIKADERILDIVKQFASRSPLEYLRGRAHN